MILHIREVTEVMFIRRGEISKANNLIYFIDK